jgi:hypothetical protein
MLRTGEYPSVYKSELEQLLEKADPNLQGRQSIPKSGGTDSKLWSSGGMLPEFFF